MVLFRRGACLSTMDFNVVLKQLTRSVKRLGVLSNSSELRRSLFNLGRLIDLPVVFRNHKMGEDSDSVKPTRALASPATCHHTDFNETLPV